MFERWGIPDSICDNHPIGSSTIHQFVGHTNSTHFLSNLISNKAIIILEGEIGVGKTSMGNYIRHSKKGSFTPLMEIPCKPQWDNDTFLGIVLASIIKEITRKNSPHGKLKNLSLVKEIEDKFSDVKLSSLGISGAGFGFQKGASLSRSVFMNQTILIHYLQEICALIQSKYKKSCPVIIQVNNLDIEHSFNEQNLADFFNDIRDTLQVPRISWIICGNTGLHGFLKNNVPRVGQIINNVTTVGPLGLEDMYKAFGLRIKASGMKGRLPIELQLMETIYEISNGSFREILNIVYQLLVKYYNEPLVETINMECAQFFFYDIGGPSVDKLRSSNVLFPVFKGIIKNPGINQKKLAGLINKRQPNVSKAAKELEINGFIRIKKQGRVNSYYPEPKYYLGFSNKL